MPNPVFSLSLLLGAALTLSACSSAGGAAPAPQPSAQEAPTQLSSGQPPRNQCRAQAAQNLVGQPWSQDMLARALSATGADQARMLRHDQPITKEYLEGRVNLIVGPDNRVQRVNCG